MIVQADGWAAIATWAGVAVAATAAWFSCQQARRAQQAVEEARASRRAAEDQATSARESAQAARTSADAAVESVKISRDTQHGADRPAFTMLCGYLDRDDKLQVRATMVKAGPPRIAVSGTWHTHTEAPPMVGETEPRVSDEEGLIAEKLLVPGGYLDVHVVVPDWTGRDGTQVRLDLECADAEQRSRQWSCPLERPWDPRSPENF